MKHPARKSPIPAKRTLRSITDRVWSHAVRHDWNQRCAFCSITAIEAHHLIPRQHEALRYELWNGIALCARHHQFDPTIAPHQNAAGFLLRLERCYPIVHSWLIATTERGIPRFTGTKNNLYYCQVLQDLRQYVPDDLFRTTVGVRFSQYLDT
jgi:hypothetical protein